jgi:UDP-N-acetylglucosamine 2-epimerase (non-hydrolysing)
MIVFFVGTAAELVKVAPVIRAVRDRGGAYTVVSSGQNDLRESELWKLAGIDGADLTLSTEPIPPRATGLARFLARTTATGRGELLRAFHPHDPRTSKGVVHGDTVSTLMGAVLFRSLRTPVHHIEAGLRSFHWREPFPEEICRVLVTRLAGVAYCPNEWAASHLDPRRTRTLVTGGNTLYDSLGLALAQQPELPPLPNDYFVLVVHRQENLFGTKFLRSIVDRVRAVRERPRCVFVMHALTRRALEQAGLYDELARDESFVLLPRQPYVTFAHVLANARYLITDGGSNQEEAYYLGKPCLLMRRVTERIEGLEENVVLSKDPVREIDGFMRAAERRNHPRVVLDESPSEIIARDLMSTP